MRQEQNKQLLDDGYYCDLNHFSSADILNLCRFSGNETKQQQSNQREFKFDIFNQPQPQQHQSNYHNQDFQLPPISTIMAPHLRHLTVPFYFHHSQFGIEECMLQMQEMHVSRF